MLLDFVLLWFPFGFCYCFVEAVTLGLRADMSALTVTLSLRAALDRVAWQCHLERVRMSIALGLNQLQEM